LFLERVDGGIQPGQLTFEAIAPMGQQAKLALLVAAPVGVTWLAGSTESKGKQGKHRYEQLFLAGFQGRWPRMPQPPAPDYRRFPSIAGTGMIDTHARSWMISASAINSFCIDRSRGASAADS
jgi:hypothetical protein